MKKRNLNRRVRVQIFKIIDYIINYFIYFSYFIFINLVICDEIDIFCFNHIGINR